MEKLLKYYLSLVFALLLFSCAHNKEAKSDSVKRELAEKIYQNAVQHYQGTVAFQNGIIDAIEVDPTFDEGIRELSVAYLKRGIPHEWKKRIDIAVELNPTIWQGYRGYNYLWFYRDYKKAIADFNATDTLTPNFIDAPQGHSVDYWRGIAYLGLKDFDKSLEYFDKYINTEIVQTGEDWVEVTAFLYRGIVHYETQNFDIAIKDFDKALEHNRNKSADAKYYKALIHHQNGDLEVALTEINNAIKDFDNGYFNQRPYVETMRQIYREDLERLKDSLN